MGNHQVRFLGEGTAAMPFPYPTPTFRIGIQIAIPRSTSALRPSLPLTEYGQPEHVFASVFKNPIEYRSFLGTRVTMTLSGLGSHSSQKRSPLVQDGSVGKEQ